MGRKVLQLLALGLAPALLFGVPAAAKSSFVEEVAAPTPDPHALAPGLSTERTVRVQNKYGANAALHLQALHVEDRENRCIRQEQSVEGPGCVHDDAGELAPWLRLTIHKPAPGPADSMVLWTGMLEDLEKGVDLMPRIPAGGKPELRIVTTMRRGTDNSTMTDRVSYDLEWTLTSTAGKQTATLQMDTSAANENPSRGPGILMASAQTLTQWPAQSGALVLLVAAALLRSRTGSARPSR